MVHRLTDLMDDALPGSGDFWNDPSLAEPHGDFLAGAVASGPVHRALFAAGACRVSDTSLGLSYCHPLSILSVSMRLTLPMVHNDPCVASRFSVASDMAMRRKLGALATSCGGSVSPTELSWLMVLLEIRDPSDLLPVVPSSPMPALCVPA